MDEIEIQQDQGYRTMDADAGVEGLGAELGRSRTATHGQPAAPPVMSQIPPEVTGEQTSLFSRMFNPEKRKVAFEDGGAGGEEDGEEAAPGGEEDDDGDEAGADAGGLPESAEDEEDVQKAWFLRQMQKMQGAAQAGCGGGIPLRRMTMRHSLREIKAEFHKMCADIDEEEGERTMKMVLSFVVRGSEWGNRFMGSPFMLNGWSGYFDDELKTGRHDRVISQLQAKYSRYAQLGPELQLARALATSAFLFHISQKCGDSVSAMLQQPDFLDAVQAVQGLWAREGRGPTVGNNVPPAMGRGMDPNIGGARGPRGRQQPMSRPDAAFIFSQDGTIRPNVGIRTRPSTAYTSTYTRVDEMPPTPPTSPAPTAPTADRASPASSSHSRSRAPSTSAAAPRSPSHASSPPSAASSDSGVKPLSSGKQSGATSTAGRGSRGGARGRGVRRTVL